MTSDVKYVVHPAEQPKVAISIQLGTVTCEVDDDTQYTAADGLNLDGTAFSVDITSIQTRVANPCEFGSSISAIYEDGTVDCEIDTDTDTDSVFMLRHPR